MNFQRWTALACLVLISVGCLSKNDPVVIRYFGIPHTSHEVNSRGRPLQFRGVTSAPYLGNLMVWRKSAVEVAFDEQHRWVSEPSVLVEEALRAVLFERGHYAPSDVPDEPQLLVHLDSFEGVLDEGVVRVELKLHLVRSRPGFSRTHSILIERPLADLSPESLARALGVALEAAGTELLDWMG